MSVIIACPHCLESGVFPSECQQIHYDDVVNWILKGQRNFSCSKSKKLIPIEALGEDLALDYVQTFTSDELQIEASPLARGGFGEIFRGTLRVDGSKIIVKQLVLPELTNSPVFAEFQREVSVMSRVRCRFFLFNPFSYLFLSVATQEFGSSFGCHFRALTYGDGIRQRG